MAHSDQVWLTELNERPNETLKKLYLEYRSPTINWLIKQFGLSDVDAEDVFQEMVFIFYKNVKDKKLLELNSKLSTYLNAIAKNLALKHKHKSKNVVLFSEDTLSFILSENTNELDTNEGKLNPRAKKILEKLHQMQDPCRSILYAFYFQGRSMSNIAEDLEYGNANVVKSQKYRCMKKLFALIHKT